MSRALQLAELGRFWATPNPHVGCVLVRDGAIIGEGFTQPVGGNHAEVEALQSAGNASGATAYVTLEPCSHQGRTGPCSQALIEAGVARVVVAMQDPNPQVAGSGLAAIRAAGVELDVGLLEQQARQLIAGFVLRMERGRGRVRAKLAMSLDGRTAMASGDSKWITGPAARADVQLLRASSCAVMTGIGTVLADDCSLAVRATELDLDTKQRQRASLLQPTRVVLDSKLSTPAESRLLATGGAALLCHAADISPGKSLKDSKAEFLALPMLECGLDLVELCQQLAARQYNEILVESGPRLAGQLLRCGLLDELIVYMAPSLLGSDARPLLELPLSTMDEKVELQVLDVRQIGKDWRFTLAPADR